VKPDLPPWLARFVAPLLVFLAIIAPVLKVLEYAEAKYALGACIAVMVISGAWAWNVWSARERPSVYGSTVRSFRFTRLVRYGALIALFACLVTTVTVVSFKVSNEPAAAPSQRIQNLPFTIYNGSPLVIWIPEAANLEVLAPSSPAVESVVATTRVRIEMPGVPTFGDRPQLDPYRDASGVVKLPGKFDLQQYLDRGLTARLVIKVDSIDKLLHSEVLMDADGVRTGFKFALRL
jgi:hypothetical protein